MNKILPICFTLFAYLFLIHLDASSQALDNQRLIVLADMGNESDEEQQITHLLLCSNEFDLEGLIAVTGKYLRPESKSKYKQQLHPELFHKIIKGYQGV